MKINKQLAGFFSLLLLLSVGYVYIAYRYFPLLLHRSIFYCQEIVKTLSLNLSGEMGKVIVGILFFSILLILFQVFKTILNFISFSRTLSKSKIYKTGDIDSLLNKLDLSGKVVIITNRKPKAFCFGFKNPRIYVSTGLISLMSEAELEVILRHEKSHMEHNDSFAFFIASIVESLFPFFPIISDFILAYRTEREILADSVAVRDMKENSSINQALKKLLQYEPIPHLAFIPDMISGDSFEARIRSLNALKPHPYKIQVKNLVISTFSFMVLLGLMVNPVQAIDLHDTDSDAVVLCADNSNNCAYACRDRALLEKQSYSSQQPFKNFSSR